MRFWMLVALSVLWIEAAAQPACLPKPVVPAKLRVTAVPENVSQRYQWAATWTCRTATGYRNETWMFRTSEVAQAVVEAMTSGVVNEAEARDKCARQCTPLTDAERAFLIQWAQPYLARVTVAATSTSATRPVYALAADGTRATTALAGQRVAVGERCHLNRRLGNTSYYSVEGRPNVATADPSDVLGDVYALCTLTTPIGVSP